jgi:hypothetical protein
VLLLLLLLLRESHLLLLLLPDTLQQPAAAAAACGSPSTRLSVASAVSSAACQFSCAPGCAQATTAAAAFSQGWPCHVSVLCWCDLRNPRLLLLLPSMLLLQLAVGESPCGRGLSCREQQPQQEQQHQQQRVFELVTLPGQELRLLMPAAAAVAAVAAEQAQSLCVHHL